MDARQERLARNETLFREVNEQVRAAAAQHGSDEHLYEFFCECSNRDCDLKIAMSLQAYESARGHPTWFLVASGHLLPEIEHVVEQREGYDVVAKEGAAARLAAELDPRS